ncbi:MAG: hypothetical protein KDK26_15350 [Roseivivax sp.]|nr:hypothetical protein [Roseivivax sp.]
MLLQLVAVIVAGVGGAGLMMGLNRLTGRRLPRWLVPLAAGAAMLATAVASEYGWYTATRDGLPQGFVVVQTVETRAPYRPWTYAVPLVTRFIALDPTAIKPAQDDINHSLVTLYLFARWQPALLVEVRVDCAGKRRADPSEEPAAPLVWREVGADDPILAAVCPGA